MRDVNNMSTCNIKRSQVLDCDAEEMQYIKTVMGADFVSAKMFYSYFIFNGLVLIRSGNASRRPIETRFTRADLIDDVGE